MRSNTLKFFILFSNKSNVNLLKALHDPEHEKYALYYVFVLAIIAGFVIAMSLGLVDVSPIEGGAVFFEGFASLYMLSRHKKTQIDFPIHLTKISLKRSPVF